MNIKYLISLSTILALNGTCWGAATVSPDQLLKKNYHDPQAAFFEAVRTNNLVAVDDLMSKYSIALRKKDRNNHTPLERAALQGYEEMVGKLLKKGASVTGDALDVASRRGYIGIITQLLQAKVSNSTILKAIREATSSNQTHAAEILENTLRAREEQRTREEQRIREEQSAHEEQRAREEQRTRAALETERHVAALRAQSTLATLQAERASAALQAHRNIATGAILTTQETLPPYAMLATDDTDIVQNMEETPTIPSYTRYGVGDAVNTIVRGTPKRGIVTSANYVDGLGVVYTVSFEFEESELNPT